MKIIPIKLLDYFSRPVTAFSMCWTITRQDGVVQGFTDAPSDLTVEGMVYQAVAGFEPTAIESGASMSVDNMEVNGLLNSDAISSADVHAGVYDAAKVSVFFINRKDVEAGPTPLKKGYIGNIQYEQGKFTAEVRGIMQPYSQNIIELCSKTCRATLGDYRCKIDLEQYRVEGTIGTAVNSQKMTDEARTEAAGHFTCGQLTFTSGACKGLSVEVKDYAPGRIDLLLPMPRLVRAGDTYTLTAGCDREVETCSDRFNNVLNFRGEPFVPDPAITAVPST